VLVVVAGDLERPGHRLLAHRDLALISLLLRTGLRRSELTSIRVSSLECQELVVAAMATVHAEGRYPSRHQVQMLLPSWVSLRGPILERLWKDEVVRLGYPRPDKPRRRTPVG
jgi:site-specific recombinase XerC